MELIDLSSIDKLLEKAKMKDKYALTRMAIERAKKLAQEKEKRILLGVSEKITSLVLKEIREGKLKPTSLEEVVKENKNP